MTGHTTKNVRLATAILLAFFLCAWGLKHVANSTPETPLIENTNTCDTLGEVLNELELLQTDAINVELLATHEISKLDFTLSLIEVLAAQAVERNDEETFDKLMEYSAEAQNLRRQHLDVLASARAMLSEYDTKNKEISIEYYDVNKCDDK